MEISDRRYFELNSILHRQSPGDRFRVGGRSARTPAPRTVRTVKSEANSRPDDLVPRPANLTRDVKEVLLVDSNASSLRAVQNALRLVAEVEAYSDFQAARVRLLVKPPDLLVTNLRLQAYNGLHLVHLAAAMPTRCIAYGEDDDLVLAREVQAAGAFYERSKRLLHALTSYVRATLPPQDRRRPTVIDRRQIIRGGRRASDRVSGEMRQLL
jgi:DNA-binding NtrC family response regulator